MAIKVKSSSRYKLSETVITKEGDETFGIMTKYDFLDPKIVGENFTNFTVTGETAGRTDLISTSFYGSPSYYWVIIMFNKPRNPFNWPEINEIIRIPDKSIVIPAL